MCEKKKWGKKARSAWKHKLFSLLDCYCTSFPLTSPPLQKYAELVSAILFHSHDKRDASVAWFLHHFPLPVCLSHKGSSVVLTEACRCWDRYVFLEWCCLVRCHVPDHQFFLLKWQHGLKQSTQLQRAARESMRWTCMCVSCCILHSALDCCSATALSDTSACQLHSYCTTTKSPITAVDVMPFIPAMFFGQELIGITFPQVCAWWLWAGVLCCSWRVPAPTVCFLPVSPSHPAGEQIPVLWNARVKWVLAWKAVVLGLTGTMGSGVSLCGIACDTLNSMFLWFLDFVSTSSAVLI